MEKEKALAVAKFKVTDEEGHSYNYTLKMYKSGAFDYGNRHCIVLFNETYKNEQLFDARYDSRFNTVESFRKYAYEFVRDQMRNTCKVEEI